MIVAWTVAYSAFTSTVTATAGFDVGSLQLKISGDTPTHDFADLTMTNMKPGDEKYALLTVDNAGTIPFNYTMTTTTASADSGTSSADATALANALQLGARVITGTTCDASAYSAGTNVMTEGNLGASEISSRGPVAVGASEALCFHVTFPSTASNDLQGKAISASMQFTATPSS